MRTVTSPLISLLQLFYLLNETNAVRKHHKRRHRHRNNTSINASLVQTKSITQTSSTASVTQHVFPWQPQKSTSNLYRSPLGPKQRGQLCDALTSSVLPFDIDSSQGLDWNEYFAFLTAIVDAATAANGPPPSPSHEMNTKQIGQVYHDMTCECHYTYQLTLSCCQNDGTTSDSQQVQVTFTGLDDKEDASEEEKQYRKNFCNGIMFILENEGFDLEIVADTIGNGLTVNVTNVLESDVDVHDDDLSHVVDQEGSGGGSTIATVVTSVSAEEESLSNAETLSTESPSAASVGTDVESSITETTDKNSTNINSEAISDQTLATESSIESTSLSLTEISTTGTSSNNDTEPLQPDASTSSIMSDSNAELTSNTNTGLSIGATIGILLAALAVVIASTTAVIHRKRQEQRRLEEFAGEELMEDDLDAESDTRENVVAMETMGGEKVYAELTPETSAENPMHVDETNGSEASSVVSVEHDEECAQISFEEQDGGVEAKVTVGSTLAAMGVASMVTGRLSAQQGRRDV